MIFVSLFLCGLDTSTTPLDLLPNQNHPSPADSCAPTIFPLDARLMWVPDSIHHPEARYYYLQLDVDSSAGDQYPEKQGKTSHVNHK